MTFADQQGSVRETASVVLVMLRNRDLFRFATREIRLVVDLLQNLSFSGHADWHVVRDV
jgi:hypothetical protein